MAGKRQCPAVLPCPVESSSPASSSSSPSFVHGSPLTALPLELLHSILILLPFPTAFSMSCKQVHELSRLPHTRFAWVKQHFPHLACLESYPTEMSYFEDPTAYHYRYSMSYHQSKTNDWALLARILTDEMMVSLLKEKASRRQAQISDLDQAGASNDSRQSADDHQMSLEDNHSARTMLRFAAHYGFPRTIALIINKHFEMTESECWLTIQDVELAMAFAATNHQLVTFRTLFQYYSRKDLPWATAEQGISHSSHWDPIDVWMQPPRQDILLQDILVYLTRSCISTQDAAKYIAMTVWAAEEHHPNVEWKTEALDLCIQAALACPITVNHELDDLVTADDVSNSTSQPLSLVSTLLCLRLRPQGSTTQLLHPRQLNIVYRSLSEPAFLLLLQIFKYTPACACHPLSPTEKSSSATPANKLCSRIPFLKEDDTFLRYDLLQTVIARDYDKALAFVMQLDKSQARTDPNWHFRLAACEGSLKCLRHLVETCKADINTAGGVILRELAAAGADPIIGILLSAASRSARINPLAQSTLDAALLAAVEKNRSTTVTQLLQHGANAASQSHLLLRIAVARKFPGVILALVRAGGCPCRTTSCTHVEFCLRSTQPSTALRIWSRLPPSPTPSPAPPGNLFSETTRSLSARKLVFT
ncbi:hypothetical protein DFS34DRAFT_124817 [Phlyctochytrium arcticum]|nr:hypothetical protein DFS34DRAFT_124817 [Phlyctochytrium arcticum]